MSAPESGKERVLRGVLKVSSGCWEWQYGRCSRKKTRGFISDYGSVWFRGKRHKANRLSYESFIGPIPEKMCVLHKCDVPACCNPEHLFLGTKKDNVTDMIEKNRAYRGQAKQGAKSHLAKLKSDDVLSIRKLYAAGGISQSQLGKMFGVQQSTIFKLVHNQRWGHI